MRCFDCVPDGLNVQSTLCGNSVKVDEVLVQHLPSVALQFVPVHLFYECTLIVALAFAHVCHAQVT